MQKYMASRSTRPSQDRDSVRIDRLASAFFDIGLLLTSAIRGAMDASIVARPLMIIVVSLFGQCLTSQWRLLELFVCSVIVHTRSDAPASSIATALAWRAVAPRPPFSDIASTATHLDQGCLCIGRLGVL